MGDLVTQERTGSVPETRKKIGRPITYTEAIGRDICQHIKNGVTIEAACGLHGIDRDTYYDWRQRREDFSDMLLRAHAEAEIYFTSVLRRATEYPVGSVEYKAAIEWLKRQRRALWGDTLDIRKIDTETLLEILNAQRAADAYQTPMAIEPGDDDL